MPEHPDQLRAESESVDAVSEVAYEGCDTCPHPSFCDSASDCIERTIDARLPPKGEPCSYNGDAVKVKGQVRTHVSLLGANFFKEVRGMVYLEGAGGLYRITLDDFIASGSWDR